MSILIIDRRGSVLDCDGSRLRVEVPGEALRTLPLGLVKRVIISAGSHISSRALCALGQQGVGVCLLTGRKQALGAVVLPPPHGDASLRLAQLRLHDHPEQRLAVVRILLLLKARAVIHTARQWQHDIPARRRDSSALIRQAAGWRGQLRKHHDINELRGLEGSLARAEFAVLRSLLPESLGFTGRHRRPPPDPFNALVSLGAVLLIGEASQLAWQHGLDPAVGFLHELSHGRPALACDLIEPLRPALHGWLRQLFSQRIVRPDHFGQDGDGGCRLGKAGRQHFYQAWGQWQGPARQRLSHYCRALVRQCRHHAERC